MDGVTSNKDNDPLWDPFDEWEQGPVQWREPDEDEWDQGPVQWREPDEVKAEYDVSQSEREPVPVKPHRSRYLIGIAIALTCIGLIVVMRHQGHPTVAAQKMKTTSAAVSPSTGSAQLFVPTPAPGMPAETTESTTITMPAVPPTTAIDNQNTDGAPPDTAGTDMDHVTRELFRYKYWLDQHPDMSMLSQIYAPGSPAYDHFQMDMQKLVDQNTTGPPPENISAVDVVSMTPTAAAVRVHTQHAGGGPVIVTLDLTRGAEGHWLITSLAVMNA